MAAMEKGDISSSGSGMKRLAVRRMWRLLVIVLFEAVINKSLFHDLEHAFLMSLVYCPQPSPPKCPEGSVLKDDQCVAEPPDSERWSFSAHCANRREVINRGRNIGATMGSLAHVGHLFAVFVLGPLVDIWGRKPLIVMALCAAFVRSGMQWEASRVTGRKYQHLIVIAASLLANMADNLHPAAKAMVADLSPKQQEERAAAFVTVGFVGAGSTGLGFIGGYFILKMALTSYTLVWLGSAIAGLLAAILAFILLEESKPQEVADQYVLQQGSDGSKKRGLRSAFCEKFSDTCAVYAGFLRNPLLLQMFLWILVDTFTYPANHLAKDVLLGPLHYSQSAASVLGILNPVLECVGAGISAVLVRRLGMYGVLGAAMGLRVLALLLVGLTVPMLAVGAEAFFWSGVVLGGVSRGMGGPVLHTVFSMQVEGSEQGRLFSLMQVMEVVGSLLGIQVFVKRLYNSDWTGWQAGTAFFLAAEISLLLILWLARIARTQEGGRSGGESGEWDESDESDGSDTSE